MSNEHLPLSDEELGRLLYRRLAPVGPFPPPAHAEPDNPITARIVDNTTLVFDGKSTPAQLRNHQLYLLNALAYQRNVPEGVNAPQLARFGFRLNILGLTDAIASLTSELAVARERLIIPDGYGRWRRYRLSDRLTFIDERSSDPTIERREELYQAVSGRLLPLEAPTLIGSTAANVPPQTVTIAGDTRLLTGQEAHSLNKHEVSLLNLFTHTGEPVLTFNELADLGFHLYNRGGQGWRAALYRAVHSLSQKLSIPEGEAAIVLGIAGKESTVSLTRQFKFIDQRPRVAAEPMDVAATCRSILQETRALHASPEPPPPKTLEIHKPPKYLDQIERLIGLAFFGNRHLGELIRSDPVQVPGATIATLAPPYAAGLRLLSEARRYFALQPDQLGELTAAQILEFRKAFDPAIKAIRAGIVKIATEPAPPGAGSYSRIRRELDITHATLDMSLLQLGIVAAPYVAGKRLALYLSADIDRLQLHDHDILPQAADTDVSHKSLWQALHTSPQHILDIAAELGVEAIWKQRKRQFPARFFEASGALAIRRYMQNVGWTTVAAIARSTNEDLETVYRQIDWHGWKASLGPRGLRIPDDMARVITRELQIIVPDEYLQIGEWAILHGIDTETARRAVDRLGIATHSYQVRVREFKYLDGAAQLALRRMVRKIEVAPAGWVTMKQFTRELCLSDTIIYQHLTKQQRARVCYMIPAGGSGPPAPHYPPDAVTRLKQFYPAEPPAGAVELEEAAAQYNTTRRAMRTRLKSLGYGLYVRVRPADGSPDRVKSYYPPEVIQDTNTDAIIGDPPRDWLPLTVDAERRDMTAIEARIQAAAEGRKIRIYQLTPDSPRIVYCSTRPTATSPPAGGMHSMTALEISRLCGEPLDRINAVIEKLTTGEFKMPAPINRGTIRRTEFSGALLDAILTDVVGLTPEAIARRLGISAEAAQVSAYLKANHTYLAGQPGRYGRSALNAATTVFLLHPQHQQKAEEA